MARPRPEFALEWLGGRVRVLFGDRPAARIVDLADEGLKGRRLIFDADERLLGLEVDRPDMLDDELVAGGLPVRRTHDRTDSGLGYVCLAKKVRSVENIVVETEESDVILDVDREGRILGIEFYGDAAMPPELRTD